MRERTTPINRLKEGVIVPPFVGPLLKHQVTIFMEQCVELSK